MSRLDKHVVAEGARPSGSGTRPDDPHDPRDRAFAARLGRPIFTGIVSGTQITEPDPFDVPAIHRDAREQFLYAVERIDLPYNESGQFITVLGEAGAGKTHLMRALRNQVHHEATGFVAYLQLSSRIDDPARYVLASFIDSLEKRYYAPNGDALGITELAQKLARKAGLSDADRALLVDGELTSTALDRMADTAVRALAPEMFPVQLLRVVLLLLRQDPAVRARALMYLRAETLSAHDERTLFDTPSASDASLAGRRVEQLARLVWAANGGAMIFLVDQLEDVFSNEDSARDFRRVVEFFRTLTESCRTTLVVFSCLSDFMHEILDKKLLPAPLVDRIRRVETTLRSGREAQEIEDLVGTRLRHLYDAHGAAWRADQPTYPFTREELAALVGHRTRDVLRYCEERQQKSMTSGAARPVAPAPPPATAPSATAPSATAPSATAKPAAAAPKPPNLEPVHAAWNDARSKWKVRPPMEGLERLGVLRQALCDLRAELPAHVDVSSELATRDEDEALVVTLRTTGSTTKLYVALTNRSYQRGALTRELERLRDDAARVRALPVGLRDMEFPKGDATKASIAAVVRHGGMCLVVADSDWRTMMAWRAFRAARGDDALTLALASEEQPLSSLESLRILLGLDDLDLDIEIEVEAAAPPAVVPEREMSGPMTPAPRAPEPRSPEGSAPRAVLLGHTRSRTPAVLELDRASLTMHAAFLGSTGSGKTTLALSILEQALEAGVPAVLIDRKGDLATYADPRFWNDPADPPDVAQQKRALQAKLDVRLYTPGDHEGAPLYMPLVPRGMRTATTVERQQSANLAASALAAMMGYTDSPTYQPRVAVLAKAIELFASGANTDAVTLEDLTNLIAEKDEDLVAGIGRLDVKHLPKLVENLEILRHRRGYLLAPVGECLDASTFFAKRSDGRVPLSIVTTKFLTTPDTLDFFVSQLLMDVLRFVRERPATTLQGLLFLDEADIYLPAISKPLTKEPLQDLLRRARSAGLGLCLATQSPGDFDYRCRDNIRTWCLGRVSEKRAADKMKALLAEARSDVENQLARQTQGQFFLLAEGNVTPFNARPSIMRTKQLSDVEIRQLARQQRAR